MGPPWGYELCRKGEHVEPAEAASLEDPARPGAQAEGGFQNCSFFTLNCRAQASDGVFPVPSRASRLHMARPVSLDVTHYAFPAGL